MNKRLLITSTDMMMIQFLVPHVKYLAANGYTVDIACSQVGNRMEDVKNALGSTAHAIHAVRLERSPVSPENLKGYGDMKRLLEENHYDIIWTNEPVMGVVTRLAARPARKQGTKVVYMCHGFHFFKGSGAASWLLFYPVERLMSHFTDVLVTINREDETRAKTMHAGRVEYIHGIGVDTQRLSRRNEQCDIRRELGIGKEDFLVLSVGELNENKNHKTIIRALAELRDSTVHYAICGKGELLERLQSLARELGLEKQVHFLGYRKDVVDICSQADVFAFPSHREGLGLAPLEAMYCGLPLVASNIRGVQDYASDGESGFLCQPEDSGGFARALRTLKADALLRQRCGRRNKAAVVPYCVEGVKQEVVKLLHTVNGSG